MSALVVGMFLWQSVAVAAEPEPARNVLLICIDDLRPVLGCYGGAAKTPSLDRFAESAVRFSHHYVQFPSCGPSRACMLGGVRPDTLGLYGNGGSGLVAEHPETRPTMPLHFRNHGYETLSFGKTYHGKGSGPGFGWSREPWQPPCGWTCYVDFDYSGSSKNKGAWRPAYEIYDGPDHLHGDYQTADQAIEALGQKHVGPFFIAAGFYKPHLPFVAPRRYWDLYDHAEIRPVEPVDMPKGAADYQYHWSEIWSYGDQHGKLFTDQRPPDSAESLEMIHAYYAAVSFVDAQVGRLLGRLDELGLSDSTAVVVWADHGFHLGDQDRWAKWTQLEADMHSPLLVRLPGVHESGRTCRALVESIDLYPTLSEYCRLERPPHLEGRSLVPLCRSGDAPTRRAALSQVKPLGKVYPNLIAYSMRTERYRYVEWRDTSQDGRTVDTELYDLGEQAAETVNVAKEPSYREAVEMCRKTLEDKIAEKPSDPIAATTSK